jgi:transcriptional regulator
MHIPAPDRPNDESEWRTFVESHAFGHVVAAGRGRRVPVVVPTQFLLHGDKVLLHLARPNPLFDAIAEQPRVLLSVAGDWAFIPSSWKTVGDEDPLLGIPTTYYAAVQLEGDAVVVDDPSALAAILRQQLDALQPDVPVADPALAHLVRLRSIRGIVITVDGVRAKFKYGGNVDREHRNQVIAHLLDRNGAGDRAAAEHTAARRDHRHPDDGQGGG